MKIGITTFYCDFNYGALLQATALIQMFLGRGHDARIIHRSPLIKDQIFRSWKRPATFARNLLVLPNYRKMIKRAIHTQEFIDRYHRYTPHYSGNADLMARWPEMDAYIAGSDQVWNVQSVLDSIFFLMPADPAKAKLISYAASFGTDTIAEDRKAEVAAAIRRFHHVSVREESGAKIVEELTGNLPEVVCDPVFLHDLDFYQSISKPYPSVPVGGYIFVYAIRKNDALERAVAEAKKRFKVPVVQLLSGLNHRAVKAADIKIHDAGPAEFLSLLGNAKCVCTNSFHGTSFALIYGCPFLCSAALLGRNTRLANLLNIFGEQQRLVGSDSDFDEEFWSVIEHSDTERWRLKHSEIKSEGIAFLENALGADREDRIP